MSSTGKAVLEAVRADPKERRGFVRVVVAVWPVGFMLLALVPVLLRGYLDVNIIVATLALLAAFFVLVIRWEFPRSPASELRRMFVYVVTTPVLAMTTAALALVAVHDPLKAEDHPSWLVGVGLLVSTVAISLALVFFVRRYETIPWVAVTAMLSLAAPWIYYLASAKTDIEPWAWQAVVSVFFGLLYLTALLRGIAYANTYLRGFIAGLAILVAAYAITRAFTRLPPDLLGFDADGLFVALAVLVLLLVLIDGWRTPYTRDRASRVIARWISLYTASLGTTALTAACIMATFGPESVPEPSNVTVLAETPTKEYEITKLVKEPKRFAARFAPVLLFPDEDHWQPITIDEYLRSEQPKRNAWTHWPDGSERAKATESVLSAACPGGVEGPCRVVTIDCGDDRRAEDCDKGPGYVRKGKRGKGTAPVYVRIVDLGACKGRRPVDGVVDRDCTVEATGRFGIELVGPYRDDVQFLVQYWYFYYYDSWTSTSLFGDLEQTHEGDWEAVTIGFSDTEPLFVGFSAHCGGRWQEWSDVKVARKAGLHPIALVARGSQAMYAGLRANIAPDWASCLGFSGAELSLVTYGLNVREDVGSEVVLWSGEDDIRPVEERVFPMSVVGRWGAANGVVKFTTVPRKAFRPREEEHGPRTPTLQPLWAKPLREIFCSKAWEPKRCNDDVPIVLA